MVAIDALQEGNGAHAATILTNAIETQYPTLAPATAATTTAPRRDQVTRDAGRTLEKS